MSSFSVLGVRLDKIGDHPNADRLDITHVGGYQAITQKNRFRPGDLAIYVPEQAVVPELILKATGFWDDEKGKGILAGANGDRVKAIKLRGVFSQGILLDPAKLDIRVEEGEDYAEMLGITKWVPTVPAHLSGDMEAVEAPHFVSYTDIENVKNFPSAFFENEIVYMTEKLHGTCSIFHLEDDRFYVASKGIASKGLALKDSESNFYWRVARNYEVEERMRHTLAWLNRDDSYENEIGTAYSSITLFGEAIGVQDLKYNQTSGDAAARFFDMRFTGSYAGDGPEPFASYAPFSTTNHFLQQMELPSVPVLFLGPYSQENLDFYTTGKESITGKQAHVREGVVVQPQIPRVDADIGRVILKSISPDYLLRKGEATEYE